MPSHCFVSEAVFNAQIRDLGAKQAPKHCWMTAEGGGEAESRPTPACLHATSVREAKSKEALSTAPLSLGHHEIIDYKQ